MTDMSSDLVQDYRSAIRVPKVAYWSQLIAGLAMAGLKVAPPQVFIGKLEKFKDLNWGSFQNNIEESGFILAENHARSEPHESWQSELGDEFPGHWVVPLNEIACIAHEDSLVDDFISIYRLIFNGSIQELTTALDKFLKDQVCETCHCSSCKGNLEDAPEDGCADTSLMGHRTGYEPSFCEDCGREYQ